MKRILLVVIMFTLVGSIIKYNNNPINDPSYVNNSSDNSTSNNVELNSCIERGVKYFK